MPTPRNSNRARGLVAAVLLFAASMPAVAQGVQAPDARWQSFLGCWTPADQRARVLGTVTQTHLVCVVPTATASAVEITTVDNGKVVYRQRVEADGAQHASTKDGCTGWESAHWSTGARRVFVRSEYNCGGGLARSASGVLSITSAGEWIDVQGVSSGGNKGVRVLRYREVNASEGAVPGEISAMLQGRGTAVSAARVSAAANLAIGDIVEASHSLDAGVVQAWLVEFNSGAEMMPGELTAKQLVTLADAGVAPSVIDVIVALAYPHTFALNPGTGAGDFRNVESGARTAGPATGIASLPVIGYDAFGYPIYGSNALMRTACSAYGYSSYYSDYGCSPYCQSFYGLSSTGCSRYGYSSFGSYGYNGYGYNGYGYYGSGYGWYPGSGGVVVVVSPQPAGVPAEQPHGRVVRGQGYTQGGSGTTATPRSSESGASGASGASSTPSSGGSSSSAGSGGSATRTAVPKKP